MEPVSQAQDWEGMHKYHGYAGYDFCPLCQAEKREQAEGIAQDAAYEIDRLTCELADAITAALAAAGKAQVATSRLRSDAVYDIELHEGIQGADLHDELAIAARALRNADRIAKWRRALLLEAEGITP